MRRTLRSLAMAFGLMALAVAPVAIGSGEVQGISTIHSDGSLVSGTRVTAVPSATGDISVN
jgi:hypothetical protein